MILINPYGRIAPLEGGKIILRLSAIVSVTTINCICGCFLASNYYNKPVVLAQCKFKPLVKSSMIGSLKEI